ncbi:MAG: hypothetical protein HYU86_06720 [Chloroflexi bacterium]|nr:hypothetical protein [Chloroflexota bacterium]
MDKSRLGGALICIGTVVAAVLFVWGLWYQSYWAVAIPVIIGFGAILALGFWIGWTMMVTETEIPAPQPTEKTTTSS